MGDEVALITGAGRGIGQAAAVELDRLGWRLVLMSRTRAELEETAGRLSDAAAFCGDVGKSADVNAAVQFAIDTFGRIDAAVACAGSAPLVPIEKTSDEEFDLAIRSNLAHSFYVTRAVWPHFKAQKSGVIVNISSLAARDPFNGFGAYAAAKSGINLFSLVAAREGAPHGIRVHVVAPGAVETKMLRQNFPTKMLPEAMALEPACVGRVIAQLVAGDLTCTSGEVIWVHK